MPRSRQNRKAEPRHERAALPPLALWFASEILPILRRRRNSESARHLRNAGIEVLEAMRSFLDGAIECLQKENRAAPMRKIEVKD
ncbi:MAG TPA: hypothetical protein VGZ29_01880 [Terriglobia bacterium]|nr:hypothetical protein [Terriglobia bacterium]